MMARAYQAIGSLDAIDSEVLPLDYIEGVVDELQDILGTLSLKGPQTGDLTAEIDAIIEAEKKGLLNQCKDNIDNMDSAIK